MLNSNATDVKMLPPNDELLTTIMIWTGASVGILKVIDWILSNDQKVFLTDHATNLWIFLDDQRSGKFISVLLLRNAQIAFVIIAHLFLIAIILSFLARVFLGWQTNAYLNIGMPRLYEFQVWIDVAAVLFSAGFLALTVHPRIAYWIGQARNIWRYFGRCLIALGCCVALALLCLVLLSPIAGFDSPAFTLDEPEQIKDAYESMLGGKIGTISVHAITALILSPIMAELMLIQTILFMSLYWLILVYLCMAIFRILQFILIRIVESPNGPVLALTGLLIGIGGLAKALSG